MTFREGNGPWHDGTSVNICARGLLFRTTAAVPVSDTIDVQLALAGGVAIQCSGRVIRTEQCSSTSESLIAIAIQRFKFRRETAARGADARS